MGEREFNTEQRETTSHQSRYISNVTAKACVNPRFGAYCEDISITGEMVQDGVVSPYQHYWE